MIKVNPNPYPPYIREFNFLRFVAALHVVLFHFGTFVHVEFLGSFVRNGYLSVDLFFILSGFVMCRVYLESIVSSEFSTIDFLIRRLARLYPLHLGVLMMFGFIVTICKIFDINLNQSFPVSDLGANLALVHGWGFLKQLSWNGPSWSISAEWFAYLCFPLIGLWLSTVRRVFVPLLVALAFLFTFSIMSFVFDWQQLFSRTYNFSILRVFPEFLLGCGIYVIGSKTSLRGSVLVPCVIITPLLMLLLLTNYAEATLAIVLLEGAIVYLIGELSKSRQFHLIDSRIFIYLGDISYSIYMTHLLVLLLTFKIIGFAGYDRAVLSAWVLLPIIAIVIGFSALTYRLIELPGRQWCVHFLKRAISVFGAKGTGNAA